MRRPPPQISNGAYDALGSHTVTCTYTDGGNLTRTANAAYTVVRDRNVSAPVVSYTLTPSDPTNIHPATGDRDGPHVLIGTSELTLDETARLGASLLNPVNGGRGGVRLVAGEQFEGAVSVLDA